MNKTINLFKRIGITIKSNVIDVPHPTLVAFGISVAVTMVVAAGLAAITGDHSSLAYAKASHKND